MSNENKKDFNSMMKNNKDMPKTQIVEDEKTIKKYGGTKMFFAPPLYYDELMKKVPKGKLITVSQMRNYLAKKKFDEVFNQLQQEENIKQKMYRTIEQDIPFLMKSVPSDEAINYFENKN